MGNRTPVLIQIPLPIEGEIFHISLTKGYVAIVDAIDADLAQFRWRASNSRYTVYALREIGKRHNRSNQMLHRVIFERVLGRELLKTEEVDHIDGDCGNNRRSNLRLATHSENAKNRRRYRSNTSGYKGVHHLNNKWTATINIDHKQTRLGVFNTPEEAYEAYCKAAIEHYGEFARLE